MEIEDNNQEQEPTFIIKEVSSSDLDNTPSSEVVEIKEEEKQEEKQPEKENEATPPAPVKEEEKKQPEEEEQGQEQESEILDLNEELAYNFLKDKKGLKFDTIDDFLKAGEPKKLDPEFEKFQEYKAKTNRGFGDFLETQRDWSKETPESIIKASIKLENPDLSSEDIDFLFDKDYRIDEDLDEDFDIKSKNIKLKVDAKKALAVLEKQKEDYSVPRGSDDDNIPEVYKDAKDLVDRLYDEQTENEEKSKVLRNDFVSKTQSLLNEKFEGFKFTIDGQEFKVKPEDIKTTREAQLEIANFQKKFFDKESKLIDSEGYHRSLFAAMDPEKLATHFFNLGKTSYAEHLEKESKNIDVTGQKHVPDPLLGGFTFKEAK